jgi:hypothetical protein
MSPRDATNATQGKTDDGAGAPSSGHHLYEPQRRAAFFPLAVASPLRSALYYPEHGPSIFIFLGERVVQLLL